MTKAINQNREILGSGDFRKLMFPESYEEWKGEALRLKRAGMTSAGVCGMACPTCYREVPLPGEKPLRTQCKCGTELDLGVVAAAHGAPGMAKPGTWRPI